MLFSAGSHEVCDTCFVWLFSTDSHEICDACFVALISTDSHEICDACFVALISAGSREVCDTSRRDGEKLSGPQNIVGTRHSPHHHGVRR